MTDTIQEFDFSVDLLKAILWEYNDATNLQSLLNQLNTFVVTNQTDFWESWLTNVFDLVTANDFGLSVWSIILGAPINVVSNATPPTETVFGFGATNGNFFNYNFDNPSGVVTQMPTEMARLYLRLRYFQLVSSGTVPEINRMLDYLFGNMGVAFLQDQGYMRQRYVFNFTPTADMTFLFNNFDILPRPAGVGSYYITASQIPFGFGTSNVNFNNGNFAI
jgi:hypothetical protein